MDETENTLQAFLMLQTKLNNAYFVLEKVGIDTHECNELSCSATVFKKEDKWYGDDVFVCPGCNKDWCTKHFGPDKICSRCTI